MQVCSWFLKARCKGVTFFGGGLRPLSPAPAGSAVAVLLLRGLLQRRRRRQARAAAVIPPAGSVAPWVLSFGVGFSSWKYWICWRRVASSCSNLPRI
jgi:hypothetical protein